ncbi:MAG: hypothetical protein Q8J84_03530 [Flavobacteriaceae bacterium]|nr:hypothetical protein [Flavobacteriaceae bacterium]
MKDKLIQFIKLYGILPAVVFIFLFSCSPEEKEDSHAVKEEIVEIKREKITEDYAVDPPPFTDGIFPCNDCHAFQKPNPVRRELVEWHDDISFKHDSENRWCLDCHDLKERDSLKLANGRKLDFKESYKLCGQCHGEKYRDWKVGVHGKRTGEWNGKKEYLLCVSCHNPHTPKFKKITPEIPPVRQEDIKLFIKPENTESNEN